MIPHQMTFFEQRRREHRTSRAFFTKKEFERHYELFVDAQGQYKIKKKENNQVLKAKKAIIILEPYTTKTGDHRVKASVVSSNGKFVHEILTEIPAPVPFVLDSFITHKKISIDFIPDDIYDDITDIIANIHQSKPLCNMIIKTDIPYYVNLDLKTTMHIKEKIILDNWPEISAKFDLEYDKKIIQEMMLPDLVDLEFVISREVRNREQPSDEPSSTNQSLTI